MDCKNPQENWTFGRSVLAGISRLLLERKQGRPLLLVTAALDRRQPAGVGPLLRHGERLPASGLSDGTEDGGVASAPRRGGRGDGLYRPDWLRRYVFTPPRACCHEGRVMTTNTNIPPALWCGWARTGPRARWHCLVRAAPSEDVARDRPPSFSGGARFWA